MGTTWIPGAERLGIGSIGGVMDSPGSPGRVVWHTTESGAGDQAFDSVARHLIQIGAQPHLLYDPTTDRLGQFGPLNESARALRNDGSNRTNRTGRVCIQIEVLARAARPFTDYWCPGPNFRALMSAIRSWGIPDTFPMGDPARTAGAATNRNRTVWHAEGGHFGHCHVPGNDHWDPGGIDPAGLFDAAPGTGGNHARPSGPTWTVKAGQTLAVIAAAAGVSFGALLTANPQVRNPNMIHPGDRITVPDRNDQGSTKPTTPAKPRPPAKPHRPPDSQIGGKTYGPGARGSHITTVGQALVAHGFGRYYRVGPGPTWTDADTRAYAAWQRSLGFHGSDADGIPGPTSLRRLLGREIRAKPQTAPPFPGREAVRYGARGPAVLKVDHALARHGYGRYLTYGPSASYGHTTRAGVKAFQRAQGWRGTDADGNVGPITWRRLMR
ncbi:peptidoglycan-binding protein [Streptomyces sp. NPDC057555]|uniref:peptidoglycan-binding protein n=1 Tax=Streptomyces sp. NPDC057555 TaxID=3346166 RepID=UPI00368B2AFC